MSYISTNKQSFGSVAREYKKYRGSYNAQLYKLIFSLIKKDQMDVSILDLGCGVGNSTEPLYAMAKKLKLNSNVTGCDPDDLMLAQGRKSAKKNKLSISYVVGSAEKLPFNKEQFDFIVSGAAFHWFAKNKTLKGIQKILKKDGFYLVFWTQSIEGKNPNIGTELYKKYKWQGIPKELRDVNFVKEIFVKSGFSNVQTISIPYTEKKTISESIGLIKTNSTYAMMSPVDQKYFIKEMTKEYKKLLGDKPNVLKQEIRICYGFKY